MALLERFAKCAADFEKTYQDDDWSRLEDYFTEDARYSVENAPFAFTARGRQAVLRAIRRSVDGFDRRLERHVETRSAPREEGDRVIVPWRGRYARPGAPDLVFEADEIAVYEGDRIRELRDVYAEDATAAYEAWMRKYGEGLDPSYV